MNIQKEFQKAEELVREILEKDPLARDDDKELLLQYMREIGMNLSPLQEFIFKRAKFTFETVRRSRQKLQERGEYVATDKVKIRRMKRELEHRDHFSKRPKMDYFPVVENGEVVAYRPVPRSV